MSKSNLKKVLSLMLVLSMGFALTACGDKKTENTANTGNNKVAATEEKTEEMPEEGAKTMKLKSMKDDGKVGEETEVKELEVTEVGYQVTDGSFYVAVKVNNPNKDMVIGNAKITVEGLDGDKKSLVSESSNVNIYPGEDNYISFAVDGKVEDKVANVNADISYSDAWCEKTDVNISDICKVGDITETSKGKDKIATGDMTLTTDVNPEKVKVQANVVYFDKDNKVVGGSLGQSVDDIKPNDPAQFEILVCPINYDHYEVVPDFYTLNV